MSDSNMGRGEIAQEIREAFERDLATALPRPTMVEVDERELASLAARLTEANRRLAAAEARIPAWLAEEQAWKETEARLLADLADTRRKLAEVDELLLAINSCAKPMDNAVGHCSVWNGMCDECGERMQALWAAMQTRTRERLAAADAAREGGDDNG